MMEPLSNCIVLECEVPLEHDFAQFLLIIRFVNDKIRIGEILKTQNGQFTLDGRLVDMPRDSGDVAMSVRGETKS
jgi:hypothetical protein